MWNLSRIAALLGYLIGFGWYACDAWSAYSAALSDAPYPFFLNLDMAPVTFFNVVGGVYWMTFGLDRSNSPKAVLGYIMAGVHVLIFAVQVWLGPMLWAMKHLAE